ncbi:MlaD domain-containing protein, partial [Haematococcus lacustris]
EARPLLLQSIKLVEEVTPLLRELREGGLVANVEALTSTAAAAAADIQKLQGAVLTDENVRALRSSVLTLCRTLEHVEGMSGDLSAFTRDSGVQRNLRTLLQALSRLVDE